MAGKANPHLNVLVQLARIDGSADESELELIRQIGSSQEISDTDIEFAIKSTETSHSLEGVEGFSESEKLDLLYNLVLVMNADGIVHREEMRFCNEVIKKMGFSEEALNLLIEATKRGEPDDNKKAELLATAKRYLVK